MLDALALASLTVAIVFYAAGSIGLMRLPDLLSRLHALTKADNLGLGLVALGIALLAGDMVVALKLLLIWLLVMFASASSSHLIARHAVEPDNGERGV